MKTITRNGGKSPDQLRDERARTEFHAYTYRLVNVPLKDRETGQPCGNGALAYVVKKDGSEHYTCRMEGCRPVSCTCKDAQYNGGIPCKHARAVRLFLTDPPEKLEPAELLAASLPAPFDVDAEGAVSQALTRAEAEYQERLRQQAITAARHARAMADRELLWG